MISVEYDPTTDCYKVFYSPQKVATIFTAEFLYKYSGSIEEIAEVIAEEFAIFVKKEIIKEIIGLASEGKVSFDLKTNAHKWYNYFNSNALGGPTVAENKTPGGQIVAELKRVFPGLATKDVECSTCGMSFYDLATLIIHLNDYEKWSREDIANWLEESEYNIQLKE